jgi:hypothetical protein
MLLVMRFFAPAPGEGMEYFLLSATVVAAASLVGGFVAALVAGGHELAHAAGLGFVMIAMSIVSMRQAGEARPGWYETSMAACGPMAALLGAAVRLLVKPRGRGGVNVSETT